MKNFEFAVTVYKEPKQNSAKELKQIVVKAKEYDEAFRTLLKSYFLNGKMCHVFCLNRY